MTTALATTSDYYITIPIGSYYSVTLTNLPSGLSGEEVLAHLTPEVLNASGELSYPMKQREVISEALEVIGGSSNDIDIEEDVDDDGSSKTVSPVLT